MILFKKANELQKWLDAHHEFSGSIAFVPTMGALHKGHISLIEAAKKENKLVICSIFVNPKQFNDANDFKKYPITIDEDTKLLKKAGCNILFLPSVNEIYPATKLPQKNYDLGYLETVLDGKFRKGHFQGVCAVVERLLEIVKPSQLYIGQKDYQQCMVISKLVEIMKLKNKLKISICPTLREKDGLAMSSRNKRLNKEERKRAVEIYKALVFIKSNIQKKELNTLKIEASNRLVKKGFKVDYVEIANAKTLKPEKKWVKGKKLVCLIAAFNNEVRLIDNMLMN